MKILQVAQRSYPAKGGVEVHTAKISEALVKMGHAVTLVVFNSMSPRDCGFGFTYQKPHLITRPEKPLLPKMECWNGVNILRFESKLQLYSYYWSPGMLTWLLENAGRFDIMHTHTLRFSNNEFTSLAHIKTRTPYILTGHDKLELDYMGKLALTIDKMYRLTVGRLLLNMAERVIAFDRDYYSDYQRLYRVPSRKIRIVTNGLDYSYYDHLPKGDKLRETLGNPEQIVLYVGRFIDYKRPDLLIAAYRKVSESFPKSRLLMLGKDYGMLSYCRRLAVDLGLGEKVVFIEDVEDKTRLQALNIADVCVVPSDYESFGLVVLEAQASGVPVIASKKGGLKYLLDEPKTGLFLEQRTVTEIAEKIIFLLKHDSIRREMGSEGRKFARKYSWENVATQLLEVYREAQKSRTTTA